MKDVEKTECKLVAQQHIKKVLIRHRRCLTRLVQL